MPDMELSDLDMNENLWASHLQERNKIGLVLSPQPTFSN